MPDDLTALEAAPRSWKISSAWATSGLGRLPPLSGAVESRPAIAPNPAIRVMIPSSVLPAEWPARR